MSCKTSTINCQCGIYDTEYTFVDRGDHITVQAPTIRWRNNSGSLDFCKFKITDAGRIETIRNMIENDTLISDDYTLIDDILF